MSTNLKTTFLFILTKHQLYLPDSISTQNQKFIQYKITQYIICICIFSSSSFIFDFDECMFIRLLELNENKKAVGSLL